MGVWDGVSIAVSALQAQRRALDVTGQNIANVNTDGYSRQRVRMSAIGGPATPAMWSTYNGSGTGVNVDGLDRLRDAVLEGRARHAQAELASLGADSQTLTSIESLFPEPGADGVQASLDNFWNSFGDLAQQPDSLASRQQVLAKAQMVADRLNRTDAQMVQLSTFSSQELQSLVSSVNTMAENLATLNVAIYEGYNGGSPMNNLLDQRDLLALQIAEAVGGNVSIAIDGTASISVGGGSFVHRATVQELAVVTTGSTVDVQWANSGNTANLLSGRAAALETAINTTIPAWRSRLDAVASALTNQVNSALASGYDLDGNAGAVLFSGSTAATFAVTMTDGRNLAASAVAPSGGAASLDGSLADDIADLATTTTSPDALYRDLIVALGLGVQRATETFTAQQSLVGTVEMQRQSESGVNLDEEMANMLAYQRAYEAAARIMSAVDEALDTLINRTGR